jgi:hypothetical protein
MCHVWAPEDIGNPERRPPPQKCGGAGGVFAGRVFPFAARVKLLGVCVGGVWGGCLGVGVCVGGWEAAGPVRWV